ncbi:MAG: pentapeptide repeat-containing protein [Thermodesulfobacteriota bacterium]|nr:pentapeptide repeat-containing protein [Thermodesulfobacteriota bacterium]
MTSAHTEPKQHNGLDLTQDLRGANLNGMDLRGVNLAGRDLSAAQLFQADLCGANLQDTNLEGAEFSAANLEGANLDGANCQRTGFGRANLNNISMFNTNLEQATLTQATLIGANLHCVNLMHSRLREANLSQADLSEADLRYADISLSNIHRTSFRNADLRHLRLRMVRRFKSANWIGVDIRDINFAGAYMVRRHIIDQNFIMEFRCYSKITSLLYYPWLITCDCGRSMFRWCCCIAILVVLFSSLFSFVDLDYGLYETKLSSLYFSVVTMTTLGFGDVVPKSIGGQLLTMLEVCTGYLMLGGLLSIFSNKLARRGD